MQCPEWSYFQIFCLIYPRVPYTCQTTIPDLGLKKYEQQSHDPVEFPACLILGKAYSKPARSGN